MQPFDALSWPLLLSRASILTVRDLAHARAIAAPLPGDRSAAQREELAVAIVHGDLVLVRPPAQALRSRTPRAGNTGPSSSTPGVLAQGGVVRLASSVTSLAIMATDVTTTAATISSNATGTATVPGMPSRLS